LALIWKSGSRRLDPLHQSQEGNLKAGLLIVGELSLLAVLDKNLESGSGGLPSGVTQGMLPPVLTGFDLYAYPYGRKTIDVKICLLSSTPRARHAPIFDEGLMAHCAVRRSSNGIIRCLTIQMT
jgi:hypothetical protein